MDKVSLINIGFKPIEHFNVGDSLLYVYKTRYDKTRTISVSCVGTPNEIVALMENCPNNANDYTDLVFISNYDYDGLFSMERMIALIFALTGEQKYFNYV